MKFAEYIQSTTNLDDLPNDNLSHVAIIGRSNVGKSSLVNHLTSEKGLAFVSSKAGRTATINLYKIDKRYYMVDLPGYGFTSTAEKRAQLEDLIPEYISNTPQLRLVLVVIDCVVGPTNLDIETFEFLHSRSIPMIIIVNKIDKLSNNKKINLMRELAKTYEFARFIPHSVNTNENRGEILLAIDETLERLK